MIAGAALVLSVVSQAGANTPPGAPLPAGANYPQALNRLLVAAPPALGKGYGCILVPGLSASPPRPRGLILQITSRRYRAAAVKAIERAGDRAYAHIGYVSMRDDAEELEHIGRVLNRERRTWPEGVQLTPGSQDRTSGCPPVVINVDNDPRLVAPARAWAQRQQRRFGTDRVAISFHAPSAALPD